MTRVIAIGYKTFGGLLTFVSRRARRRSRGRHGVYVRWTLLRRLGHREFTIDFRIRSLIAAATRKRRESRGTENQARGMTAHEIQIESGKHLSTISISYVFKLKH